MLDRKPHDRLTITSEGPHVLLQFEDYAPYYALNKGEAVWLSERLAEWAKHLPVATVADKCSDPNCRGPEVCGKPPFRYEEVRNG